MKYIAINDGFIGGKRIRKGQVFNHEGKPGKWMEPAKEAEPVKAEKPVKGKQDKPENGNSASNQDVI